MKKYLFTHIYYSLFFLWLNTTICIADTNNTDINISEEYNTTIDRAYKHISNKVLDWSEYLDVRISSWLDDNVSDPACLAENIEGFRERNKINKTSIDYFFQNNRYLNDTKDIYIRLRLNNYLYSKDTNKINMKLSAQLPFDRCKKQWKIFLQDPTINQPENRTTDTSGGGLGIRYYPKDRFGIHASYSLGFTEGSPYIRSRYKFPLHYHSWKIEPVQIFKYSSKYYFEEETNIYFDKTLGDDLFRMILHRKSASTLTGTDYGLTFQYYLNLGKNAGLRLTQSFFGNTHYSHYYAFDKNYNHINNYVTSISWRENIWRKWLYYEIRPTVNFHKDHNYDASYTLQFLFDVYFGEYR